MLLRVSLEHPIGVKKFNYRIYWCKMTKKKISVNDRVKRIEQAGCFGTVKDVREEVTAKATDKDREGSLLINVAWDNGTLSYMTPDALEIVTSAA